MKPEQRAALIGHLVVEIEDKKQAADRLRGELRCQAGVASAVADWLKVPMGSMPRLLPFDQLESMARQEQDLRLAVGRLENQLKDLGITV